MIVGGLTLAPRDHSRDEILANASHRLGAPGAATAVQRQRRTPADLARHVALPRTLAKLKLDRLLALAGPPPAWTVDRILLAKLILPSGVGVLGLLFVSADPTPVRILTTGIVVVVCFFVPDLLLRSKGNVRQRSGSYSRTPLTR